MNHATTASATGGAAFLSLLKNPLKFRLYLLKNLPAAFFAGLRVVQATTEVCTVSAPFKWFTKNPFRSTYFACLTMGAELSTGVLAMAQVHNRKPAVSMLLTSVEGRFYKKATGLTLFTCEEGQRLATTVQAAIATGAGQEARVHTIGRNEAGEVVAEFWFVWSFKARQ